MVPTHTIRNCRWIWKTKQKNKMRGEENGKSNAYHNPSPTPQKKKDRRTSPAHESAALPPNAVYTKLSTTIVRPPTNFPLCIIIETSWLYFSSSTKEKIRQGFFFLLLTVMRNEKNVLPLWFPIRGTKQNKPKQKKMGQIKGKKKEKRNGTRLGEAFFFSQLQWTDNVYNKILFRIDEKNDRTARTRQ